MPHGQCHCVAADELLDNIRKEDYLFHFECIGDAQVNLDCNCHE